MIQAIGETQSRQPKGRYVIQQQHQSKQGHKAMGSGGGALVQLIGAAAPNRKAAESVEKKSAAHNLEIFESFERRRWPA